MPTNSADQASSIVARAGGECRALGHDRIGTEHLLLALLQDQASMVAQLLKEYGVTREQVLAEIGWPEGRVPPGSNDPLPLSDAAHMIMGRSPDDLLAGSTHICAVHVLLAILDQQCAATEILEHLGITPWIVRNRAVARTNYPTGLN